VPDVKVDFLRASSYGAASESSGAVKVQGESALDRWSDHHIVLVRACARCRTHGLGRGEGQAGLKKGGNAGR
jgi:hypothetical protein